MNLGVTHNFASAASVFQHLSDDTGKALASAMNTTVRRAQFDVVASMRQVFDRPTPYALGGLRIDTASARRLTAAVMVRGKQDAGGSNIPAESFLKAEIEGGSRAWKRSERALQKIGILPAGWYAIPAKGARLDAYGNMSRGQIVEILSWFEAFPETNRKQRPYRANSTVATRAKRRKGTRTRSGYEYFAVQPGNKGLRPGIYQRTAFGAGKGVRPVLVFVSHASYRKRLDFYGTVEKSFGTTLDVQVQAELRKEIG